MTTKYTEMNVRERKVFDSIYAGWYLSGKYRALLAGHERLFEADSPSILFHAVEKWYATHEANHRDARLLVKCVEVL